MKRGEEVKETGRRATSVLEKRSRQLEASATENTGVATKKTSPTLMLQNKDVVKFVIHKLTN